MVCSRSSRQYQIARPQVAILTRPCTSRNVLLLWLVTLTLIIGDIILDCFTSSCFPFHLSSHNRTRIKGWLVRYMYVCLAKFFSHMLFLLLWQKAQALYNCDSPNHPPQKSCHVCVRIFLPAFSFLTSLSPVYRGSLIFVLAVRRRCSQPSVLTDRDHVTCGTFYR